MAITCSGLVDRHATAWNGAIQHPFLEGCRTGRIAPQQFETWLLQDSLFVVEFTRFAARTLADAPAAHFDVLINGLAALRDELSWFRAHATSRGLQLAVPPQAACAQYCRFMERLADAPYPVQATAFWAIEAVYFHAWRGASPMAAPYDEFARRWGSDEFGTYVEDLARQADEELGTASGAEQVQAEAAFVEVLGLEALFWQMAFSRDTP
jgi:thiaminase/transcriptional activator TenA